MSFASVIVRFGKASAAVVVALVLSLLALAAPAVAQTDVTPPETILAASSDAVLTTGPPVIFWFRARSRGRRSPATSMATAGFLLLADAGIQHGGRIACVQRVCDRPRRQRRPDAGGSHRRRSSPIPIPIVIPTPVPAGPTAPIVGSPSIRVIATPGIDGTLTVKVVAVNAATVRGRLVAAGRQIAELEVPATAERRRAISELSSSRTRRRSPSLPSGAFCT